MYVVGNAAVGEVQIIGLRRELTGEGVYLLHYRQDAQTLSVLAHLHHCLVHRHLLSESHSPCDLEIREAQLLGAQEKVMSKISQTACLLQFLIHADDVLQTL